MYGEKPATREALVLLAESSDDSASETASETNYQA
jgi:hypothetical protein